MPRRRQAPVTVETDLLVRCRRRCCLCFGLKGDLTEKLGQVAHVDGDPSNSVEDNLVFLCFDHHSQYDSTSKMGKGLKRGELIRHRSDLYKALENGLHVRAGTEPKPHKVRESDVTLLEGVQQHAIAWYNEVVSTIGKLAKAQSRDEFIQVVFEYSNSRQHLPELLAAHRVLSRRRGMQELARDIERFLFSLTGGTVRGGYLSLP